ncbi:MAG TPA: hypothetical protein VHM31_06695 [Polyangia bacterium]|nr:hypothetical protein [Polyangia bacterium]
MAAARYGIEILFTAAMSNHHHTGIHDRHGNYPEFLAYFHKLFAKCQNALRGRWENFWSSEQTSVVRLVGPEDLLSKMAYALTNPVKDGLVERAHHWPGITSIPCLLHGKDLVGHRPDHFFRDEGPMPESASLRISKPPGFESLSDAEFRLAVLEQIARVEHEAAAERRRTGRGVVGRQRVLAQAPTERPVSNEPRRELSPRIACINKWRKIEILLRSRAFRDAYISARAAFVAGVRDVVFPAGTYWLRRLSVVTCAAPGTS